MVTPTQLRVLIVDDSKDAADTLGRIVQLWGHTVRVAYSGEEALQLAQAFCPHVSLVDIVMPGMDGRRFAKELHDLAGCRDTVIVAVSGRRHHEHPMKTVHFDDYFVKPVNAADLEQLLQAEQLRLVKRESPPH